MSEEIKSFVSKRKIDYQCGFQLDGTDPVLHANYKRTPILNNTKLSDLPFPQIKKKLSAFKYPGLDIYHPDFEHKFLDLINDCDCDNRLKLWECFWLDYYKAFDSMAYINEFSIVSTYLGRHATELGLKYLILKEKDKIPPTHNLEDLARELISDKLNEYPYFNDVTTFLRLYEAHIEGGRPEYFRYPEYKNDGFFAGINLDISWINEEIAIVLLKLIHYAGLDQEAGINTS